jgi:hypothetical protein
MHTMMIAYARHRHHELQLQLLCDIISFTAAQVTQYNSSAYTTAAYASSTAGGWSNVQSATACDSGF